MASVRVAQLSLAVDLLTSCADYNYICDGRVFPIPNSFHRMMNTWPQHVPEWETVPISKMLTRCSRATV